jgi:polo-like kinase 4
MKNVVLHITGDHEVVLEFTRMVEGGTPVVVEVMVISKDGGHVSVFHPDEGVGCPLDDRPVCIPSGAQLKEYEYTQLPPKYRKRYEYATRFVRLVQSKTPKVTLYTEEAKIMLMEDAPAATCEVMFYSGAKVIRGGTKCQLIGQDGSIQKVSTLDQSTLSAAHLSLWNYAEQCHAKCMEIETILTALESDTSQLISPFPAIIGSRPSSRGRNMVEESPQDSDSCKWEQSHPGSPSSVSECESFNCSNNESTSSISSSMSSPEPHITNRVFVPGVGWGSQLSTGVVLVQFLDGSELSIQSSPMVIIHKDLQDQYRRFTETDPLPSEVCDLLDTLPAIMMSLQQAALSHDVL